MTIKKQWLIVLVIIAVISVIINTLLLSTLTNQYFKNYMKDNYDKHFDQIVQYLTDALKDNDYSANQIAVKLETHLTDPITKIKVYNAKGTLITEVSTDAQSYAGNKSMNSMMNGMMGRMMGKTKNTQLEEVDHSEITYNKTVIGQVNITKYSSAENSFDTWMFQTSLVKNSILSIGIVLIVAVIIGLLVSSKMSKELINTAEMAQNVDIGKETLLKHSKVKEINIIQQSLVSLQSRLKLKQKSRKSMIDELVHQTRTPLTILKTHLEGIEDGVIDISPDEIRICENQIENITAIITNMSSMIDAEKPKSEIKVDEFDLNQIIKQIVNGLKAQFDKKKIDLKIMGKEKVLIKTDKYLLSQTIYNILTNAYKFTKPSGYVTITYQSASDKIVITIEDNGPGISKEDQGRIFDAYYKKDNSTGSAGDGIGLYIAKENMESINGTITVQSEINKGSKFILTIPRNCAENS
jgi:signal transduction histidine kinase